MKKLAKLIVFINIIVLLLSLSGQAVLADQNKRIEKNGVFVSQSLSNEVKGKVVLAGNAGNEKIKIMVKKDSYQQWYEVNTSDGNFNQEIWLTEGKGNYTVSVMIHKEGRKYIYGPSLVVNNIEDVNKFLVSTKHVESDNPEIIKLSNEITGDKLSDREKAKAIYDWVSSNINYDYTKFSKHEKGDYENSYGAINTLITKSGVCYDYSALTAALGRAAGLQVKMIRGQAETKKYSGLHAWNEIYISEESQWISLDATFGSSLSKNYFGNSDFGKDHIKEAEY